jgi:phosphopantetheinyl transferase (holo-ACP synthase)
LSLQITHAQTLSWLGRLPSPYSFRWYDPTAASDHDVAATAVRNLFARDVFPAVYPAEDLHLLRDPLGKPYIRWQGAVAEWARARGYHSEHLHITNTHDGGAHIVLAAYNPQLAGLGIDAVYLPRLRTPGKTAAYLRRFAGHFMSEEEQMRFNAASANDDEETLRVRVAAHFSLMEAASKALGTGLKIGGGMGGPGSLPKQSLGAKSIAPQVEWLLEERATERIAQLGASHIEAHWGVGHEFLISVAMLWRQADEPVASVNREWTEKP